MPTTIDRGMGKEFSEVWRQQKKSPTIGLVLATLLHGILLVSLLFLPQKEERIEPVVFVQFDLASATAISEETAESSQSAPQSLPAKTPPTTITDPPRPTYIAQQSSPQLPDPPKGVDQQMPKTAKPKLLGRTKKKKASQVIEKPPPPPRSEPESAVSPALSLMAQQERLSNSSGVGKKDRDLSQASGQIADRSDSEQGVADSRKEEVGCPKDDFDAIRKMILHNLTFPAAARKMGWTGKILVKFTIKTDGNVADIAILSSSGHALLDANLIRAIRKTSPFPKPTRQAQLLLPIAYKLQ